jgi:hypothetical protein
MFSEVARAGDMLIEQGMPDEEVRAVLSARDPVVVRRHLELHRERLTERLAEQRAAVDRVERLLVWR